MVLVFRHGVVLECRTVAHQDQGIIEIRLREPFKGEIGMYLTADDARKFAELLLSRAKNADTLTRLSPAPQPDAKP
jgi:hypothetical protein